MLNRTIVHSFLSKTLSSVAIATLGLTIAAQMPASAVTLVDVELSLLVDVSGSVDATEFALQIQGYKNAFTNIAPQFGTTFGSVAVNFIQWSGSSEQVQSIPWTLVNSQASALQFANAIGTVNRAYGGSTAPGSAIQFATPLFNSNDFQGKRLVIDVSGDGEENDGVTTSLARNNALAAGISAINGLPIIDPPSLTSPAPLEVWYRNNIQGGDGSFIIPARGFGDFGRAIEQKLRIELDPTSTTAVPEPFTVIGTLIGGAAAFRLRKRFKATNKL
jgi:hypothetical protein